MAMKWKAIPASVIRPALSVEKTDKRLSKTGKIPLKNRPKRRFLVIVRPDGLAFIDYRFN
jgi:hypothetical protein